MILVVNKIDRPDARTTEVVDEVYELFLDLDADEHQIEFPILYADARAGRCGPDPAALPEDLEPLFDALRTHIPAPSYEEDHPLQALVTQPRRLPVRRPARALPRRHGTIRRGQEVAWCRADGTILPGEDHRALRERGARPRRGRGGRAGRDRRRRRHRRDHDRRDARRSRRPAPAAGHPRRRAVALDDDRDQHLAAFGARRRQAHRAAGEGAPRPGGHRQRLDPRAATAIAPTAGRSRGAASSSSRSSSR